MERGAVEARIKANWNINKEIIDVKQSCRMFRAKFIHVRPIVFSIASNLFIGNFPFQPNSSIFLSPSFLCRLCRNPEFSLSMPVILDQEQAKRSFRICRFAIKLKQR